MEEKIAILLSVLKKIFDRHEKDQIQIEKSWHSTTKTLIKNSK